MRQRSPKICAIFITLFTLPAMALEPLLESELGAVVGGEGVTIDMPNADITFGMMVGDGDGSDRYELNKYDSDDDSFWGFDQASFKGRVSLNVDAAYSAADGGHAVALGYLTVDMSNGGGFNIGEIWFDPNYSASGKSSDAAKVATMDLNSFIATPLEMLLSLGYEPADHMMAFNSGEIQLWEATLNIYDSDGFGASATPGVVGFDVVYGAKFNKALGDIDTDVNVPLYGDSALHAVNDNDNYFDLAGKGADSMAMDITSEGLLVRTPRLLSHLAQDGVTVVPGFSMVMRKGYLGLNNTSLGTIRMGMNELPPASATMYGLSDGIGVTIAFEESIALDYMQLIDIDGARITDNPYAMNRASPTGYENDRLLYDPTALNDCENALSACGGVRMEGRITPGTLSVELHASTTQINSRDVSVMSLVGDWSGIELAVEMVSGYELGVGSGGGKGSWGQELRLTNVDKAHVEVDVLLYSNKSQGANLGKIGTGTALYGLIGDETEFDIEFKDVDALAQQNAETDCEANPFRCDSTDSGQNSYHTNRMAARDISPMGDIEFNGAFFDADPDLVSGGLVVNFPTMTGSIEVGKAGVTNSGIMLNGEQAARLVLNDWNINMGVMTIKAH